MKAFSISIASHTKDQNYIQNLSIVLTLLYKLGNCRHYRDYSLSLRNLIEHYTEDRYPMFDISSGGKIVGSANSNPAYKLLDLETDVLEMIQILTGIIEAPLEIKIPNVGDYEAIVTENVGIKVGCQTISFAKVKEIADAVEKVKTLP